MKLYIPVGISGSGKSHLYSTLKNVKLASMDELRKELTGNVNDQSKNNIVYRRNQENIKKYLEQGFDVYVDCTNLDYKTICKMRTDFSFADIEIIIMEDSYDKEKCLKRIQNDISNGKNRANITEEIINRQYKKFLETVKKLKEETTECRSTSNE